MNCLFILVLLSLPAIHNQVHACMEFSGSFPFSHTAPFEASIIDNGVTTCWISTSLNEHNDLQKALAQHQHDQTHGNKHNTHKKSKRSNGRAMQLMSLPAYDPLHPPYKALPGAKQQSLNNEKSIDLTTKPRPRAGVKGNEEGRLVPTPQRFEQLAWDDMPVWQPWKFQCLQGYTAKANVGLRGFTYVAHGQEFFFVPDMREDLGGERWVYKLELWCKGKDGKGGGRTGKGGVIPPAAGKKEGVGRINVGSGAVGAGGNTGSAVGSAAGGKNGL
ncbi:hypothetical protein VTL71DRAFT_561 [Oculimacula yallundae]|uniref:Uncharacterized protein n=1 Tax=Oculimacula yallundae TaxID=86028 RepID=A0ABR4D0C9_9HELO